MIRQYEGVYSEHDKMFYKGRNNFQTKLVFKQVKKGAIFHSLLICLFFAAVICPNIKALKEILLLLYLTDLDI